MAVQVSLCVSVVVAVTITAVIEAVVREEVSSAAAVREEVSGFAVVREDVCGFSEINILLNNTLRISLTVASSDEVADSVIVPDVELWKEM